MCAQSPRENRREAGALSRGGHKPHRQAAPWDSAEGCVCRRSEGQGEPACCLRPPQLPHSVRRGALRGAPAGRVASNPRVPAGLALKALRGGWLATHLTHSSPDAARCKEVLEPMPTPAFAATPRRTPEGVTGGGQSGIGVGIHAAEDPTSALSDARWSRVKGQCAGHTLGRVHRVALRTQGNT